MAGIGNNEMSRDELAYRANGYLNQLIEAVGSSTLEQAISELVNFLDSVSKSVISEVETEESGKTAYEILDKIHQFVSLPSLNQV
ncbi:aberrant root formation protein 4 [Dorcoceras hygrometricum]|uniref:Aberrant root formation protein 4 n=1 Tax=Dorcoceras hygrometricum TaxID=472368 RepID=A0A2Z7AUQ4_9LAMI|nr:aberrant root formation protein 4 [Dorcoceras hygrometricum]